jgi:ATP-dependent Lon protease
VDPEKVKDFLGVIKYRDTQSEKKNEVGLAQGLAWTEVGGQLLGSEATLMEGKGKLTLTGKLGDVMQESAQAAMSYVRTRAASTGTLMSTCTCRRGPFPRMARRRASPWPRPWSAP